MLQSAPFGVVACFLASCSSVEAPDEPAPGVPPVTIRVFTSTDLDDLSSKPVGTMCFYSGYEHKLPEGWVVCRGQTAEQAFGQWSSEVHLPRPPDVFLPCSAPMSPGPRPGIGYTFLVEGEDCSWGWEPHPLHLIRRLR